MPNRFLVITRDELAIRTRKVIAGVITNDNELVGAGIHRLSIDVQQREKVQVHVYTNDWHKTFIDNAKLKIFAHFIYWFVTIICIICYVAYGERFRNLFTGIALLQFFFWAAVNGVCCWCCNTE